MTSYHTISVEGVPLIPFYPINLTITYRVHGMKNATTYLMSSLWMPRTDFTKGT